MARLNRMADNAEMNEEAIDEIAATKSTIIKVDNAGTPDAKATIVEELYVPTTEDEQPSLNQLAIVLGIPAVRLQSAQVAYKPIVGQPYNAKQINWANVSAFISRRLDKVEIKHEVDGEMHVVENPTIEDVYTAALQTKYEAKRFGRASDGTSVYGKVIFGTTPLRKGNVQVGDTIYNKKDKSAHTVIFVNDTIVVYEPIHDENTKVVSEAIGNRMFNMNFVFELENINEATAVSSEAAISQAAE